MKYLRIVHTASKCTLVEGPLDQYFEINKYLFFKKEMTRFDLLQPALKHAFGFRLGIYGEFKSKSRSDSTIPKGIYRVIVPSPFGFFLRNYYFIIKRDQSFTLETSNQASSLNPLSLSESEIMAGAGDIKTLERIGYLIKETMTIIDHRDSGKSLLLKSKLDGRLFQLLVEGESLEKPVSMLLAEVTHQQWAYLYLEQRERKKKGEMPINPDDYLDSLEEDKPERTCEVQDCNQGAVKYSSLCKSHHFEAVMGRMP
jgi:hypothetical protein